VVPSTSAPKVALPFPLPQAGVRSPVRITSAPGPCAPAASAGPGRAGHTRLVQLLDDRLGQLALGHRVGLDPRRADAVPRRLGRRVGRAAQGDEQREQADVVALQVLDHSRA